MKRLIGLQRRNGKDYEHRQAARDGEGDAEGGIGRD